MVRYLKTAALVAVIVLLDGCVQPSAPQPACVKSGLSAPAWVCDGGHMPKHITAVATAEGMGRISKYTHQDALKAVQEKLYADIQRSMYRNVQRFLRDSGGLDDALARKVALSVVKQTAKLSMRGVKPLKHFEETPLNRLHLLGGVERRYVEIMAKRAMAQALRRYSKRKEWSSMVGNPKVSFVPPPPPPPKRVPVQKKEAEKTAEAAKNDMLILNEEVFGALSPYGEEREPLGFTVDEPSLEVVDDAIVGRNRKR